MTYLADDPVEGRALVEALTLYELRCVRREDPFPAPLRRMRELNIRVWGSTTTQADTGGQELPASTQEEAPRVLLKGERLLTYSEVADLLKVSKRTVQRYGSAGRLPVVLVGASPRVDPGVLRKLIDEGAL